MSEHRLPRSAFYMPRWLLEQARESEAYWRTYAAELRRDNANLAMAVRYVLHDHPGDCDCYGCTTERRYRA